MAKWIVVEKICSCWFVAGLAPTDSILNPVQEVTEICSHRGRILRTFSEGCDAQVQHGSLVPPSFPAKIEGCCDVMLAPV